MRTVQTSIHVPSHTRLLSNPDFDDTLLLDACLCWSSTKLLLYSGIFQECDSLNQRQTTTKLKLFQPLDLTSPDRPLPIPILFLVLLLRLFLHLRHCITLLHSLFHLTCEFGNSHERQRECMMNLNLFSSHLLADNKTRPISIQG